MTPTTAVADTATNNEELNFNIGEKVLLSRIFKEIEYNRTNGRMALPTLKLNIPEQLALESLVQKVGRTWKQ